MCTTLLDPSWAVWTLETTAMESISSVDNLDFKITGIYRLTESERDERDDDGGVIYGR